MSQQQERVPAGALPPKRLLQVIASMDPAFGGPQENASQLSRALSRLGGTADIVTLDDASATWGAEGCSVFRIGPARWGNYCYSEQLLQWMHSHAHNYDAVIVHGLWQYVGLATWRALSGTDTPYYVFPHGMLDPWFKKRFPLKHLKKSLYWPWAEYRVLRDAQAVLFTCEEERRLARQTFSPYRVREAVVGCGISGPTGNPLGLREKFLSRQPQLRGKRLLLFLGRVHPKKGCDELIDAFAEVAQRDPHLHLVMAGPADADYQATLARRTERLRIDSRVCWTGMLRDEMKWGAYHAAEVFVLPSHQENFGIAVAEALACGVPVLISNKVNIWREIVKYGAGLVADDTQPGITGLMRAWLDLPAQQCLRMRTDALSCFDRHFHIDTTTANLLNTLRAPQCTVQRASAA
jgi:glycosyltransferase involved in cell wall biosynthesis